MIIERERERERWYLPKLWVKSLMREKLMWLQSQRNHNCRHLQWEITTVVFFLVPFFKEKWNYKLFFSNGLNKFQIWMIGVFFFFLNFFFFCWIICSLVIVWSSLIFVWVIFVVIWASFYCYYLNFFI